MKKLYFIIVALLAGLTLNAEPFDVRATCRSHGLTINAYVTPFEAPILFPFANNTIQLLIVFFIAC
jgi:hypothetical protein